MFNKITNKIDQNEHMIQMQDWILEQISLLNLTFEIKSYNRTELLNNILSPSRIRFEIIETLLKKIDTTLITKLKNLINLPDEENKIIQGNKKINFLVFIISVKLLGVDIDFKSDSELKKIICGISGNYENLIFLTKLIEQVNLHNKLFSKNNNYNLPNNNIQKNNYPNKKIINNKNPNKEQEPNENISFTYEGIDCLPSIPNNEITDSSDLIFSFENLNIINSNKKQEKDLINKNISEEENKENIIEKKHLVDNEIINSVKIIENITKNKKEIFKEKIRLFPPEIKLKEKKNYDLLKITATSDLFREIEINHSKRKNEIIEKFKVYQKNMVKVDKKLDKLRKIINENYELMDTEDYIKLKQNMILFEKNIESFLRDFNQIFSADIKYIPQEKFSNLHLFVEEFEIKNDKLFNLGKSIEEVFSYINRLIK